jgi:hypothetical protein
MSDETKVNGTKRNKTTPDAASQYSVTLVSVLSDDEQFDAARRKAAALSGIDPSKLMAIGKPSKTDAGLKVEFGVQP